MQQHIFQFESEPRNHSEAALKASPSFTICEKLERYGTNALSVEEHLVLLVGKQSIAAALIRHFGSVKALSRVALFDIRQFPATESRSAHGCLDQQCSAAARRFGSNGDRADGASTLQISAGSLVSNPLHAFEENLLTAAVIDSVKLNPG